MKVTFARLARLPSIGESTCNGVDYTSDLLGGLLFLWRLSIVSLLVVSLSSLIFFFVPSFVRVMTLVLIL